VTSRKVAIGLLVEPGALAEGRGGDGLVGHGRGGLPGRPERRKEGRRHVLVDDLGLDGTLGGKVLMRGLAAAGGGLLGGLRQGLGLGLGGGGRLVLLILLTRGLAVALRGGGSGHARDLEDEGVDGGLGLLRFYRGLLGAGHCDWLISGKS
jgi:hypothetical protein